MVATAIALIVAGLLLIFWLGVIGVIVAIVGVVVLVLTLIGVGRRRSVEGSP